MLLALSGILLHGCGGSGTLAPVEDDNSDPTIRAVPVELPPKREPAPPSDYRVVAGDTLFSIAWRHDADHRELARWNGIGPPYVIYPGQRLLLRTPPAPPAAPAQRTARTDSVPPPSVVAATPHVGAQPVPPRVPATPTRKPPLFAAPIRWQWPARGKIISARSVLGQRGINILGERGQPVTAAAPGEVVYSGSGLTGYGKLIIIKHDETFLSAYAHNDKLLVGEGTQVSGGQQIAEMGSSGSRQVMLHFEIRRDGKPVPPTHYLP